MTLREIGVVVHSFFADFFFSIFNLSPLDWKLYYFLVAGVGLLMFFLVGGVGVRLSARVFSSLQRILVDFWESTGFPEVKSWMDNRFGHVLSGVFAIFFVLGILAAIFFVARQEIW